MFDKIRQDIEAYQPFNEQERADKALILEFMKNNEDAFLRTNLEAHMTSSAWIVNKQKTKVLMIYHNIYDSWAWTGGHADGEEDLLSVAIREANEETGITATPVSDKIFSIERLTVDGHIKRGKYVPSHMHLNVSYLLEADDSQKIRAKEDENKAVAWFDLDEALTKPAEYERWVVSNVYKKLNDKLKAL